MSFLDFFGGQTAPDGTLYSSIFADITACCSYRISLARPTGIAYAHANRGHHKKPSLLSGDKGTKDEYSCRQIDTFE